MKLLRTSLLVGLLFCCTPLVGAESLIQPLTPPAPPQQGPGSATYAHAAVHKSVHGEGGEQFWLFQPEAPRPQSAPVVVFMHGWSQINPRAYGAWIDHIVRRGHIVIYPRYQAHPLTLPREFMPNTIHAVRMALALLAEPGHVQPEEDQLVIVGHSCGGILGINLAAVAQREGLPLPQAVMSVQPGRSEIFPLERLTNIAAQTLLLVLVSDRDTVVGELDARRIVTETTQIPTDHKNLVRMHSDLYGPGLLAHHMAPLALNLAYDWFEIRRQMLAGAEDPRDGQVRRTRPSSWETPPNALDYHGFWKLFDGLCDAAFRGTNRHYALGNTPEQRSLGAWSDGTPVREMEVVALP